jgi:predicted transcriptional regulator
MQEEKKKKHVIQKYIDKKGMRKDFFCKQANLPRPSISVYLKGADMMLSTAARIVESTNGEISFDELAREIKKKI